MEEKKRVASIRRGISEVNKARRWNLMEEGVMSDDRRMR